MEDDLYTAHEFLRLKNPSLPRDTPMSCIPADFQGAQKDGYAAGIVGGSLKINTPGGAEVELLPDAKYALRVINGNNYDCLLNVSVDNVEIGRFLLQAFTECDIERPVDRPLGFTFAPSDGNNGPKKSFKAKKQAIKSTVTCTFSPEAGSRVVEIDVRSHETNKSQRLEILRDVTISDFYSELEVDFGAQVRQQALIHWTCSEFDSPVEDVFDATHQMALRNCKRKDEPVRKMSLLTVTTLAVLLWDDTEISLSVNTNVTIGELIKGIEEHTKQEVAGKQLYILSNEDRLLCSSKWSQNHVPLLQLMQKDEILTDLPSVEVHVETTPPSDHFTIYARPLLGKSYELEVCPDTSVRECRYQLEILGGPWGQDPQWMFAGTVLESKRTLGHYGIKSKDVVDVVWKWQEKGEVRVVEKKPPIAVEGNCDTKTLMKAEGEKCSGQSLKMGKKKLQRGRSTVLRGRSDQQFIEVDPIDIDDRFKTLLSLTLEAKNQQDTEDGETSPSGKDRHSCILS